MIAGRKLDKLIHQIVFKAELDQPPKYSKDFLFTALLLDELFSISGGATLSYGYCDGNEKYFAEIEIDTPYEEIKLRKLESTHLLAICSLAIAYFGPKGGGDGNK